MSYNRSILIVKWSKRTRHVGIEYLSFGGLPSSGQPSRSCPVVGGIILTGAGQQQWPGSCGRGLQILTWFSKSQRAEMLWFPHQSRHMTISVIFRCREDVSDTWKGSYLAHPPTQKPVLKPWPVLHVAVSYSPTTDSRLSQTRRIWRPLTFCPCDESKLSHETWRQI